MNNEKLQENQLLYLLEQSYESKDGLSFYPNDDRWKLSNLTNDVNVINSDKIFSAELIPYYRIVLARYATFSAVDTVKNIVNSLILFSKYADSVLSESNFIKVKTQLGQEHEYTLSCIRGFLRFWYKSGVYGISYDFINAIGKIKIKGNIKGKAVLSNDPENGPYTVLEMQAIVDGINNSFLRNGIGLQEYVLIQLYIQRGIRRAQIAQLVFSDFKRDVDRYYIEQPRSKQRNVGFREEFTRYEISEDLYNAVQLLKEQRITEIEYSLKKPYVNIDDFIPLYLDVDVFCKNVIKSVNIDSECFHNREVLDHMILGIEKKINAISERTGEVIKLRSRRFRSTLGTDLAREGAGVGVIATALDHTDHQNAKHYIKTSADMATRLNSKIGKLLAPLAQAFAGMIISDENNAERGNDPRSRIRNIDGSENIGSCSNYAFCNANAPVACYTCIKFQPWVDADHTDVLADLYEERQNIIKYTGDHTIASILDRSILAVEDVIRRCDILKEEVTKFE